MWNRSVLIPALILALALALFLAILADWTRVGDHSEAERTDDAYVRADQTPLSTRISGTVREVNVGDYQPVNAEQLLVELNDPDYKAIVAEAKAALEGEWAEYVANQDAKRVADAGISAAKEGIEEAEADSVAAETAIAVVQANVTRSTSEYLRQQALFSSRATTRQQVEEAEEGYDRSICRSCRPPGGSWPCCSGGRQQPIHTCWCFAAACRAGC